MRVVLSGDMEAIAGIAHVRDLLACQPSHWETGRAAFTADVVAAATGLLEGGADEVVVLDNHASGHPENIIGAALPDGARLETWNVFDLSQHGIAGMLQVGYHPRAGIAGFAPHSYVPGLHLWVDDEEIGEAHGRIWATAGAPLLGITGHAALEPALGSLAGVPFLAVQDGSDPHRPEPRFREADEAAEAIRAFARDALLAIDDAPRPQAPAAATFTATVRDAVDEQAQTMEAGGWTRTGEDAFALQLCEWPDAREPLAAAMGAAMHPFLPGLRVLDMGSAEAARAQDPAVVDDLTTRFIDALAAMTEPTRRPGAG
jgi:D-amino peptidase